MISVLTLINVAFLFLRRWIQIALPYRSLQEKFQAQLGFKVSFETRMRQVVSISMYRMPEEIVDQIKFEGALRRRA